jgi:hypothetical protein
MPASLPLLVHATHEAGLKIGGIGAVLDGLLSAKTYNQQIRRTVLVGPLNAGDSVEMERLTSARNALRIHYSSLHGIFDGVSPEQRAALQRVEQTFEVGILYGTRQFGDYTHEVLLADVTNPNRQQVNSFKFFLWQHYGLNSARYEWNPEFNQYISLASPLFAALKALGADAGLATQQKSILAHEWLGMPVVFAAQLNEPGQWRTFFYAHETATARMLIEGHSGHDTRFYNALFKAREWGLDLETVFGRQDDFFKHVILKQAARCDNVLAVGDLVVEELRFLGGAVGRANIDLVYNGAPAVAITLQEKLAAKRRLQKYCENLLGYAPDFVFTHVTRLVLSKALWRDLRVLEHLDGLLQQAGQRAVLLILSTNAPAGRRPEWVMAWEQQYSWPVGHRGDNGDLLDLEVPFFFGGVEPFNRRALASQVVFVNQFGWSRDRCGQRMPAEMEFMDIRKGSDLEFGQSIYEPFGIAQIEPLSFGALCCASNVCGCVGFVARAAGGISQAPNVVVADYVTLPPGLPVASPYDALRIDQGVRNWIEGINSVATAQAIFERLPRDGAQSQALLDRGQAIAEQMSWEVVVRDYLLPSLHIGVDGA